MQCISNWEGPKNIHEEERWKCSAGMTNSHWPLPEFIFFYSTGSCEGNTNHPFYPNTKPCCKLLVRFCIIEVSMTTIWSVTRWSGQVALFRLSTWASSTLHCALGIRPCSHTVQTTSTVHCTTPCHLKLWWQQKSLHSSSMQNSAVHFTVFKWCKGTKMCSIKWAQRTECKVQSNTE